MDEIEKTLKNNSFSLLIDDKAIGSSICLITETKLYFFTAKHCLVDSDTKAKRYNNNSNISFERYYNNATYSLNETDTIINSKKYDLSVIISRFVNAIPLITNKKVYSTNLTPYNTFFFKGFPNGYQVFDKTQGRLFRDLKYLEESDLDKNIITIKTAGDEDFLIIRSDFESNVKGISGSGVYFTNKKLPYLSHIVNSFQKVYKDLFITSLIPIIRELKLEIPIVEITEDFNDKDGVVKITEENQSSQIQTISAPIVNLPVKKVYLDIDGYMRRNLTDNINFQVNSFMSIFDKDSTFNSNTAIDILLENKENKFIILSDASFGKSIELKNIAAYFSKESEEIFPILVLLRDYNNENLQNFLERTYTNWKQIPLNRLLLLFDGLDELPDNKFNSIINEINTFSENNQEVKIVVSCRTNFYDAQVNQERLRGFKFFYIEPLNIEDINEYVSNNIPNTKIEDFRGKTNGFNELLYSPFYLINLVKLFNENSNQFPKTKVEVFNYLVDLSIKEDKKHFVQNENISIGQIDEIKNKLIDIAFVMSLMGKNSIDKLILKYITDQDLRLSGLLYIDEDKCEFGHNNFQEYFSAIKLSKLSFEDIKEIIFFKPNYEKIKPKWINTLSFLFSILSAKQNSSVFKQLLNYVSGKEPSILIRFETDKITEDIKFTIFKTLLEDAEEKNIYLYKAGFNNYDLAKFSQMTDAIILYLFGKLDNSHSNILKYSVLSILQYVKEINPTQIITFNKETKKILIKIIKNNSDIQLVGLAIRCISDFIKDGEEDVIDDIISNCREIKNHEIRRSLNYFLNKIKNPDKYLNFIKESIDIFEDFSRSSNNVSYSHSHDIENFLLRNTSFSFVKDVLKLLINDTELLNTYSHRRFHLSEEFFQDFVKNIIRAYRHDKTIYTLAVKLLVKLDEKHKNQNILELLVFFDKTKTTLKIFKKLYANDNQRNWFALNIANKECLLYLFGEYKKGKLKKEDIILARNQAGYLRGNELSNWFYTFINEKTNNEFEYLKHENHDDIRKKQMANNQNILLNEKLFTKSVIDIFSMMGKDIITRDELFLDDFFSYAKCIKRKETVGLDWLRFNFDGEINKESTLKVIEENWEWIVIRHVVDILSHSKTIDIVDDLIVFAKEWVHKQLPNINFKEAVTENADGTSWSIKNIENTASYLIKELKIIDISDEILLDLIYLDFEGLGGNEITDSISIFLIENLDEEKIKNRIISNFKEGLKTRHQMATHINLAGKLEIKESLIYIYNILVEKLLPEYVFTLAIDIYNELGGSYKNLKVLLEPFIISQSWQLNLLENLKTIDEDYVIAKLESIFSNEYEPLENKIIACRMLLNTKSIVGLEYLINYIKIHEKNPLDDYRSIGMIKTTKHREAIELILSVIHIPFKIEFNEKNGFNSLLDFLLNSINEIILNKNDNDLYVEVRERIILFINQTKLNNPKVSDLYHFLDRLELMFYQNKEQILDIKESLKILSEINNKVTLD